MNMENQTNRTISGELKLLPGCEMHYGKVELLDDGYFLFTGDGSLEIDELICTKEDTSFVKYEFLIQPPDGNDGAPGLPGEDAESSARVSVRIHCLRNTVRVKSLGGNGGNGGDGAAGGDGGNGGDCAGTNGFGGLGGNGGDGGDGGSGGNGGPAPEVTVSYAPGSADAEVLVLTREDVPCPECVSFGGLGGRSGKAGRGGSGGKGGRNADGSYAEGGKCGRDGAEGRSCGTDAPDGYVKIIKDEAAKL